MRYCTNSAHKIRKALRYLNVLLWRKMPTETHSEMWLEFDRVLNWRAILGLLSTFASTIPHDLTGRGRAQLSEKFLE